MAETISSHSIPPEPHITSAANMENHEAFSKIKKLTAKLQELQQKIKFLQGQKQQLNKSITHLSTSNQQLSSSSQILQNNLINTNNLLKIQKKQTQLMKQQIEYLKSSNKQQLMKQQIQSLQITITNLENTNSTNLDTISKLKEQILQNQNFSSKISNMSQLITKAKEDTEECKLSLAKQKEEKEFYKHSLTVSIEKGLIVEQEFSRYKNMTKIMFEDLNKGFSREKKVWRSNYENDLLFYKQEYELFKGFVEDILKYLKVNNLYSGFQVSVPKVHSMIVNKM